MFTKSLFLLNPLPHEEDTILEVQNALKIILHISYYRPPNMDPWRNGSASDSRSEGCVFDSRRVQF